MVSHLDILDDIFDKTAMNSSNFFKESIKKITFLFEDKENKSTNKNIKN